MRLIDINGNGSYYRKQDPGGVSTRRSGHAPVSEAQIMEDLAAALRLAEALEDAITNMRKLLKEVQA